MCHGEVQQFLFPEFLGIGGGIILIPLLALGLRLDQHQAQGATLAAMLLPNGLPGTPLRRAFAALLSPLTAYEYKLPYNSPVKIGNLWSIEMKMWVLLISLGVPLLAAPGGQSQKPRPIVVLAGSYRDVPLDHMAVLGAMDYIKKNPKRCGIKQLQVVQSAAIQVVAGMNVKLVAKVITTSGAVGFPWEFVIYHKLDDTWECTTSKHRPGSPGTRGCAGGRIPARPTGPACWPAR